LKLENDDNRAPSNITSFPAPFHRELHRDLASKKDTGAPPPRFEISKYLEPIINRFPPPQLIHEQSAPLISPVTLLLEVETQFWQPVEPYE
jgi:hypothetical protein